MAGINWLIDLLRRATTGKDGSDDYMTADRALSYAPVWYSVNRIAGHVARLPLNLHREKKVNGKVTNTKPTNHLGYRLLRVRSNTYQTPYVFKRQMMAHALLWGNGRAYIHRDGLMSELIPLMPDRTATVLVDGEKVHFVKLDRDDRMELWDDIKAAMRKAKEEGQSDLIALADSEVLHVHGLGFDGVEGKSLISLAQQSWGLGIGAESQERNKQRRGYNGGLMLEAPPNVLMKEDEAREFLKHFREQHDGEKNSGKTALLRAGITAKAMAMSNHDAQFIEQRRFQRQDVALWFQLESILGDDSSVSYNSLEQKNLAYLQNCLGSWLTIWEEECEAKLLTTSELERGYYFKFNDGALLRTDKKTTAEMASVLIASRVINPNEARSLFDMNPYAGGDEYANPAVTPGGPNNRPKDPVKKATNQALTARLDHLLKIEAQRAIQACSAANFVDRVDAFYAKWQETLAKTVDESLAAKHCEESKAALLACADSAKDTDALTAAVEKCVASWPERVASLVQEMELAAC